MVMDATQVSFPSVILSGALIQCFYIAQDMPTIVSNQIDSMTLLGGPFNGELQATTQ